MFTSYPFVGICKRGRKIWFPDPGIEIFTFNPFSSSFRAADHFDDWRVQDFNLFGLLDCGHVDTILVDPEGLNPDATAFKLQRLYSKYLSRKKHRNLGRQLKMLFLADPLEPGELFHHNPVVREIVARVKKVKFHFIPRTTTAMEFGYMFQYLPSNSTDEEIVREVRESADEVVRAFVAGETEYAEKMLWWISTLMQQSEDRQQPPTNHTPRPDLATLCKQMRV